MPESYIYNNILVVDDEPAVRAGMARVFAAEGYQVFTASSGDEALGMMATQAVNLAILDMKMPGMDGVELLQTIGRDHPETSTCPAERSAPGFHRGAKPDHAEGL
jgi:CheY-like chemotaxis protein